MSVEEKRRRAQPLAYFASYEEQDLLDLRYGGQAAPCERFAATVPNEWADASIDGEWTPDED